jgi:hypothetical protein
VPFESLRRIPLDDLTSENNYNVRWVLSSSESEDTQGALESSTGDTTEDQQTVLSKSDGSSVPRDSVGPTYEKQIDPELLPTAHTADNVEQVTDLQRDRDMIALECVAE